jgi:hypothetical protein
VPWPRRSVSVPVEETHGDNPEDETTNVRRVGHTARGLLATTAPRFGNNLDCCAAPFRA